MSSEAGSLIPSPFRYHSLATSTYSLSTGGSAFVGATTIAPYMPLAMWASTGLVPQWYMKTPGSLALKRKVKDSPGMTSRKASFGRDPGRVEVDRVRDRAAVRERHLDGLALANVHDRAGGAVAVEGPGVVLDAGGDLDGDVLEGHVHLDEVAGDERRQRRVVGLVRSGELGRVLRHDAGEAAQRQRNVVIDSVVVSRRGLSCARRASSWASAHIISAKTPTIATVNPSSSVATIQKAPLDSEEGGRCWFTGYEAMADDLLLGSLLSHRR